MKKKCVYTEDTRVCRVMGKEIVNCFLKKEMM